jgi:hypothetical protein
MVHWQQRLDIHSNSGWRILAKVENQCGVASDTISIPSLQNFLLPNSLLQLYPLPMITDLFAKKLQAAAKFA